MAAAADLGEMYMDMSHAGSGDAATIGLELQGLVDKINLGRIDNST